MSSIGGYFELELKKGEEYHKGAIRLNTGRNAFEYILCAKRYKRVYLPLYTCDVMLEPIKKLGLDYEFYSIDISFKPIFDFKKIKTDEAFVYNNYFGICDKQVLEVASKCENLIIDNSQSFYSSPLVDVDTFYSPRKFFGLPDGGYLYTNKRIDFLLEKDVSYNRCEHLLGRIDTNAEQHFQVYKENSRRLSNQPIRKMSNLTQRLLVSIDFESIARKRKFNFNYIHNELGKRNKLRLEISSTDVPMVYLFLVDNGKLLKNQLISKKIYVASYWPNVIKWVNSKSFEYDLAENLLAIPIDQRYSKNELDEIIKILK